MRPCCSLSSSSFACGCSFLKAFSVSLFHTIISPSCVPADIRNKMWQLFTSRIKNRTFLYGGFALEKDSPVSFISPLIHRAPSQKQETSHFKTKINSLHKKTFCQRTHFYFLHVAESCKQATKNTLNKIKLHICPQPPSVPPVSPHQSPQERVLFK